MAGSFYPNNNSLLVTDKKITVSSSAPSSPSANDLWYEIGSTIYPEPWVYDSGLSAWRSSLKLLEIDSFTSASIIAINSIPFEPIIPLGSSFRFVNLYTNIYTTLSGCSVSLEFVCRQHNGGASTDTSFSTNTYGTISNYTTYSYTINQTFSVGSNTSHLIYINAIIIGTPAGSYWVSPKISYYHLR